jgi:hypothetical protein
VLAVARRELRFRVEVNALASGLEVIRYHGLGNETTVPQDDPYYRVNQATSAIARGGPARGASPSCVGLAVRYADTRETPGRIVTDAPPYGVGNFGQAGLRAELRFDGRDMAGRPTRGARFSVGGALPGRMGRGRRVRRGARRSCGVSDGGRRAAAPHPRAPRRRQARVGALSVPRGGVPR